MNRFRIALNAAFWSMWHRQGQITSNCFVTEQKRQIREVKWLIIDPTSTPRRESLCSQWKPKFLVSEHLSTRSFHHDTSRSRWSILIHSFIHSLQSKGTLQQSALLTKIRSKQILSRTRTMVHTLVGANMIRVILFFIAAIPSVVAFQKKRQIDNKIFNSGLGTTHQVRRIQMCILKRRSIHLFPFVAAGHPCAKWQRNRVSRAAPKWLYHDAEPGHRTIRCL